MKRLYNRILKIIIFGGVIFILCTIDIGEINNEYVSTLINNITLISNTTFKLLPFFTLLIFIFFLYTDRWTFRVERASFGGFNIIFDNTEELFIRQVSNFLNTKRTIFKIDIKHDNFDETFTSFHEVYKFLRDEMKVLGNMQGKKARSKNRSLELFDLSNDILKVLNEFLTTHQSNYRRWYKYIEKSNEKYFHTSPIGELQENYSNYEQLVNDFYRVNKFFCTKIAKEFDINIEKWGAFRGDKYIDNSAGDSEIDTELGVNTIVR